MAIEVLFRDARVLAVAKPSGLLVHRGPGARDEDAAVQLARDAVGAHVYPVHRLDRGTSGVLLFALSSEDAATLHAQFEAGGARKRYLALVRGVAPDAVTVDHPVPRHEDGPRVPAVTEVRRLAVFERYSLVEAFPHTGRFHQVRRHLKHLSHPVIGDVNYGKGEHNRLFRERFGLHRLALHAEALTFAHPADGALVRVTAPLPQDLRGPFAQLGFTEATWQ